MYKEIFNELIEGILILEDGKLLDCNAAALKIFQYQDKQELLEASFSTLSPEFQPDGKKSVEKFKENEKFVLKNSSMCFEWVHFRANGTPFWVEVSLKNISTDEKVLFLVMYKEIEEKRQLEAVNAYQGMILKSVINSSSDVIFYKDYANEDGRYIGCNKAYEDLTGKSKDEIIGHTDKDIYGEELGEHFRNNDLKALENQTEVTNETWLEYPNGKKALFHTRKSILKDEKGNVIGVFGISRDITNTHIYQQALKESSIKNKMLANTDPLTGIMNRRAIFDISENLHTKKDVAVLMLDVDDFKEINDTYGHEKGDLVLKCIVETCSENLREEDAFARLGGEEFVIVLHNAPEDIAKKVTSRLIEKVSHQSISDDNISVTVSVGLLINNTNTYNSFSELLNDADKALYKAKEMGKNQYQLYSE